MFERSIDEGPGNGRELREGAGEGGEKSSKTGPTRLDVYGELLPTYWINVYS